MGSDDCGSSALYDCGSSLPRARVWRVPYGTRFEAFISVLDGTRFSRVPRKVAGTQISSTASIAQYSPVSSSSVSMVEYSQYSLLELTRREIA